MGLWGHTHTIPINKLCFEFGCTGRKAARAEARVVKGSTVHVKIPGISKANLHDVPNIDDLLKEINRFVNVFRLCSSSPSPFLLSASLPPPSSPPTSAIALGTACRNIRCDLTFLSVIHYTPTHNPYRTTATHCHTTPNTHYTTVMY